MTDFMKQWRQAQKDAKTFEGMQYQLQDMLNGGMLNASNNSTKNSTATQSDKNTEKNEAPAEVQQDTAPKEVAKADENIVEYTYKPGDTFGQVILDLGLNTDKGLWGADGDVAYYTQQLYDQGIRGNVPVGATIRLRRRGAPEQPAKTEPKQEEKAPEPQQTQQAQQPAPTFQTNTPSFYPNFQQVMNSNRPFNR